MSSRLFSAAPRAPPEGSRQDLTRAAQGGWLGLDLSCDVSQSARNLERLKFHVKQLLGHRGVFEQPLRWDVAPRVAREATSRRRLSTPDVQRQGLKAPAGPWEGGRDVTCSLGSSASVERHVLTTLSVPRQGLRGASVAFRTGLRPRVAHEQTRTAAGTQEGL